MTAERPTRRRGSLTGTGAHQRWEHAPLARELFVINNLMTRCGDRLVADLGLTAARWKMLGAIDHFEEPPTLSDLSAALGAGRPALLARLQALGLTLPERQRVANVLSRATREGRHGL